jgi:RHS repeat-associated protein
LIFSLFRAVSGFFGLNGGDDDGGDEGRVAVHVGVVFGQEADGNLTNDGRWSYIWDAENRLIQMTANTSVGPPYQVNFAYDYQGRRIEKIVLIGGVPQSTNLFLYDGWNMVAELKSDNTLIRGYLWGTDLSGSPQGAGGVGGLVEMSYAGTNCFVAYDGNGNVAALVNAGDGTVVANYEYGPFGEVIRATGPMAKANPIRFSTKYQDNESDLVYYGYRYYDPSMGKWLSRDPMTESGFDLFRHGSGEGTTSSLLGDVKLDGACYAFIANEGLSEWDYLGLCEGKCGDDVTQPLLRTLDWIRLYYGTLGYGQRLKTCVNLYNITDPGTLQWAWDILYLANVGFGRTPSGSGGCERTVTFMHRCYYGGAANYAMWGKVNKICFDTFGLGSPIYLSPWSLPWAESTVFLWKVGAYHRFGNEEGEALAFTAYGYTGIPLLPWTASPCEASERSVEDYAFQFRWLPYRNPDHKP